jgi:hypothetical protein
VLCSTVLCAMIHPGMHIILSRPTLSHFCTFIPLQCDENDVATEHEISSSATATPYRYFILTLTRLRFHCEVHVLLTIEHLSSFFSLFLFFYSPPPPPSTFSASSLSSSPCLSPSSSSPAPSDELYCKRSQLLQRALELLTSCPCGAGSNAETHGCPSCLLDQRYLSTSVL